MTNDYDAARLGFSHGFAVFGLDQNTLTGKPLSSYWPVTAMGPLPPWVILERALMSSPSGERNPSRPDSHAIDVIGRVPEAELPATV